MPKVLKQVIAPGTYWVNGEPFTVTADDCRHWATQTRAMLDAGLPIRVPLEHQSWAAEPATFADADERKAKELLYNRGFVSGALLDEADESFWTELDVPDADLAKRLETEVKFVSPRFIPEFTDGSGRKWQNPLAHVALTAKPVWHGQKPFGAKPAQPVALSLGGGDATTTLQALELSLHDRVVQKDGEWQYAPVEPVDLAVEWKEYTHPKTGKHGWKSSGGRVVYTAEKPGGSKPEKQSPKKPTTPAPTAKAPAKTNPGTGATKGGTKSGTLGKSGYSKDLQELTAPVLKGVAIPATGSPHTTDLEHYARELKLTDQNLANARGLYTKWANAARAELKAQKKTPSSDAVTKALADTIQEAINRDAAMMERGHTRTPKGALYAARMVAYRHMLDWAQQDHDAAKAPENLNVSPETRDEEIHGKAQQAAEERGYKESLREPLKKRLAFIHEHRKVEVETSGGSRQLALSGPQRFAHDVVRGLFAQHGATLKPYSDRLTPQAWQDELDKYRAALQGGEARIKTGTATNNETGAEEPTFKTVRVEDPKRFVKTFNENILKQIKAGHYDEQLRPVLAKLSNDNRGTLSPDEFKKLAGEVKELSLPVDLPTRRVILLRPVQFGRASVNTALAHPLVTASLAEHQQFHWQMREYHRRRFGEHTRARNLSLLDGHAAAFCHHNAMYEVYADPTNPAAHAKALDWRPLHASVTYRLRGDRRAFQFSVELPQRDPVAAIELSFDPPVDAVWRKTGPKRWETERGQVRGRPPVEFAWRGYTTEHGIPAAHNIETGKRLYGPPALAVLRGQQQQTAPDQTTTRQSTVSQPSPSPRYRAYKVGDITAVYDNETGNRTYGPPAEALLQSPAAKAQVAKQISWLDKLLAGPAATEPKPAPSTNRLVRGLKALGVGLAGIEHAAKHWVSIGASAVVDRLPDGLPTAVKKTFFAGVATTFAIYKAGEAFTERVAKEKGLDEQQAKRLSGSLAAADMALFVPSKIAALSGVPGGETAFVITGLIPCATAAYLAHSTATDPGATYRAARNVVADVADFVSRKAGQLATRARVVNASLEDDDDRRRAVAEAMARHGYDDWWFALFSAALEKTPDVARAIAAADAGFSKKDQSAELAVEWEPYTNPKTKKQGWKSKGGKGNGRIVYSTQKPGGTKTATKPPRAATPPNRPVPAAGNSATATQASPRPVPATASQTKAAKLQTENDRILEKHTRERQRVEAIKQTLNVKAKELKSQALKTFDRLKTMTPQAIQSKVQSLGERMRPTAAVKLANAMGAKLPPTAPKEQAAKVIAAKVAEAPRKKTWSEWLGGMLSSREGAGLVADTVVSELAYGNPFGVMPNLTFELLRALMK